MSEDRSDLFFQSQFTPVTQCASDQQNGKSYTMQAVRVNFPYVAYPSQVAMMDKIIRSLRNKHNCLLESPTGSGKSAALLCSTLAWQKKELERIQELEMAAEAADRELYEQEQKARNKSANGKTGSRSSTNMSQANRNIQTHPTTTHDKPNMAFVLKDRAVMENVYNNEDNDFQPQKRYRMSSGGLEKSTPQAQNLVQHIYLQLPENILANGPVTLNVEEILCHVQSLSNLEAGTSATQVSMPTEKSDPVSGALSSQVTAPKGKAKPPSHFRMHRPKIFFCTRTHKQVKQITRELANTHYRDAKMCVLSSRDQTCIHPHVSKNPNKNEGCRDLLKNPGGINCSFYLNVRGISQSVVKDMGLDLAWDLEDIVSLGKKQHFCPYYALRELMQSSDIIFCPYNYLTDPLIRDSMDINLKGNIVILDEGHNIEEFAREAASFSVNQNDLNEVIKDLEKVPHDENQIFAKIMSRMSTWIGDNSKDLNDYSGFDRSGKVLAGHDLVAMLSDFGAGPENLGNLNRNFSALSDTEGNKIATVLPATQQIIKGLLFTLDFLYRDQMRFMSDYRCVIVKTFMLKNHNDSDSGWRRKSSTFRPSYTYTLNFWCLNPAVCFSDFHSVHSLIVTSGTLSPMVSFESELALSFPIAFEANHVIKKNQVWVGSIGCGPNKFPLKAVYQNMESLQFQDELGQVVLQICQTVPHGVLCFFPSYSNLDKMTSRWQLTGLMDKLENTKVVVAEPRASNKAQFEEILQEFYSAVDEGALFLAVYRGKVSEGLNFSDDNARAVITIGIPYPNVKDIQVDLKQKYNNEHSRTRSLMSGRDWYEAQAFRALNQALGRCIRHRGDWGALILVDQRFQTNVKYGKSLSKWVRNELCHYQTFHEAMDSLKFFTKKAQDFINTNPALNASIQSGTQNSVPETNASFSETSNVNIVLKDMNLSKNTQDSEQSEQSVQTYPNEEKPPPEVIVLSSSPELF